MSALNDRPPAVTVALPVYNEALILADNLARLVAFLDERGLAFEILIGSNGSTDASVAIAEAARSQDPRIRVFHLPERGVGLAFAEFVRRAEAPFLISLDMDLSADLGFVDRALALAHSHDIVVGSKKLATQQRSRFRKFGSDTFLWFARRVTGLPYDDYSIGTKAYNVAFLREHAGCIDAGSSYVLDLCCAATEEGRPVTCVPVACEDRRESKFNLVDEAVYKFTRLFVLWRHLAGASRKAVPVATTRPALSMEREAQ